MMPAAFDSFLNNGSPIFKPIAVSNALAAAWLPLLLALTLSACASRSPAHEHHRFVPVTRTMQDWGALNFDNRTLQLEALKGDMKLEYVGALPETAGKDLAGAAVYRIKNADKYYAANKSQSSFCPKAARWVALNSAAGAPAWSSEIYLALLTVDDWASFEPRSGNACASGKYIRAGAE
jgi:hypothetical protein